MNTFQKLQIFAISHVLREFGFRKRSDWYFVKPEKEEPVLIRMNFNNCWRLRKYDFNKYPCYKPKYSEPWDFYGSTNEPIFSPFDKEGFICSVPDNDQIVAFCLRHGIKLHDSKNFSAILLDLILAYRKTRGEENAFEKYFRFIAFL